MDRLIQRFLTAGIPLLVIYVPLLIPPIRSIRSLARPGSSMLGYYEDFMPEEALSCLPKLFRTMRRLQTVGIALCAPLYLAALFLFPDTWEVYAAGIAMGLLSLLATGLVNLAYTGRFCLGPQRNASGDGPLSCTL